MDTRKMWLQGEMEWRKEKVLTDAISLDDEARKNFLSICEKMATRIADDQEMSAETTASSISTSRGTIPSAERLLDSSIRPDYLQYTFFVAVAA